VRSRARVGATAITIAALALWVTGGGAALAGLVRLSGETQPVIGGTPPACALANVPAPHRGQAEWARTILDTTFTLGAGYVPLDLVPVAEAGVAGRGKVRSVVIADLWAMARAAGGAGSRISVDSAYRSYADQLATFDSYEAAYGTDEAIRSVARAGHSEHQLGTTIDVAGDLDWLADNAWRYGFVMSYPADASPDRTCYKPEAWHYRYVGRATAAAVHRSGLSLREWLWAQGS